MTFVSITARRLRRRLLCGWTRSQSTRDPHLMRLRAKRSTHTQCHGTHSEADGKGDEAATQDSLRARMYMSKSCRKLGSTTSIYGFQGFAPTGYIRNRLRTFGLTVVKCVAPHCSLHFDPLLVRLATILGLARRYTGLGRARRWLTVLEFGSGPVPVVSQSSANRQSKVGKDVGGK